MMWKALWKPLAGAAVLAGLIFGIWLYGNHRESTGYNERDVEAKLELGRRQTALYEEQMKNEQLRFEADRNLQSLKADTAATIAGRDAINRRLRQQIANGVSNGGSTQAPGGTPGAGADWVAGFAACYEGYGMLGDDFARTADKLRGLQDFIDPR